jgi:hypothetical protein
MRQATDLIEALRYKLRMFGIDIMGPTNVFGDNKSVITNSTIPESTLSRKHNSICYHRVREAVAAGIIRITKVHTESNLADIFTKPLPTDARNRHLEHMMYRKEKEKEDRNHSK